MVDKLTKHGPVDYGHIVVKVGGQSKKASSKIVFVKVGGQSKKASSKIVFGDMNQS